MIVQKNLLGLGYKRVSYFKYKEIILSDGFTSDGFLVVVDRQAIFDTEFSYKLYCQKQNEWMKNFSRVYRFVEDDLKMAILYLQDSDLDYNDKRTINRESLMIDPSPLESTFESCFEMVYGSKSF